MASISLMSGQELRGSVGEYQADEQAGVGATQLASIRQMSGQVSRGSAGDFHFMWVRS